MKLKNQVCSLELATCLKELGVKQESLWWWAEKHYLVIQTDKGYYDIQANMEMDLIQSQLISAFTCAELGEMLPYHIICDKRTIGWRCEFDIQNGYAITENIEANTRAKCLTYLLENDIISVDDINRKEKK